MNNEQHCSPFGYHVQFYMNAQTMMTSLYISGTTGWVGADGYLRLQDYIADNQGYRIYKSKTVYVGENRPISVRIY